MGDRTFLDVFKSNAQNNPHDVIIKYKKNKGGSYVDLTWSELTAQAKALAAGLIQLGLEPGQRVALLSYNRLEWILADLGTMMAGGVTVPIYHTNTPQQCEYIIKDSGARFLVVEDLVQLYKIQLRKHELGDLDKIILIEGKTPRNDQKVFSFSGVLEQGRAGQKKLDEEIDRRSENIGPDDLSTIVYTSGTTGPPKGCMISQNNTLFVLKSIDELISLDPRANLGLLILPLSHFYPRVSGYYYNLFRNVPLAIGESIDSLAQNMSEVCPTYFCSVPRILEKIYAKITGGLGRESWLKRLTFNTAVKIGRARNRKIVSGRPIGFPLSKAHQMAMKLVFSRIRQNLGGRLNFAVSAGAPLSAEVGEFIQAIGLEVLEFYGLTETIGGAMTTFGQCRYGTVGKPMPGFSIKLAPDNEILIKGNNFSGYYNQPDLTAQVMENGWCRTGDVGRFDPQGFLIITDRKKDLIITSGGKNISPQNLENALKSIPLVSNVMVIGDGKNFLTALFTLDKEETEILAREKQWPCATYEDLVKSPEIKALVQTGLDRVNQQLARFETIKKFTILPRDFTQEEGEITPTLKLKRKTILNKYRETIEAMYRDENRLKMWTD